MKQILFFSALWCALAFTACGGGASEQTTDEAAGTQSVQADSLSASADSVEWKWTGFLELPKWAMHRLSTVS